MFHRRAEKRRAEKRREEERREERTGEEKRREGCVGGADKGRGLIFCVCKLTDLFGAAMVRFVGSVGCSGSTPRRKRAGVSKRKRSVS